MKSVLFIIVSFLATCCTSTPKTLGGKYFNQVGNSYINDLEKEKNLKFLNFGGQVLHGIVKHISLIFESKANLSLDEARILILGCTEIFLKRVHTHQKILPYLASTPENILDFGIIFSGANDRIIVDNEHISCVYIDNGIIVYNLADPITERYKIIHKETYQDALKIVEKQSSQPHQSIK